MTRLLPSLVLLAACAGGPCTPPPPTDRPTGSVEDGVARALPAVVLLVARRADGGTSYGAGVLVDGEGHILTNLHVVGEDGSPRVLLHDPARPAWSPLDGGLERLLFEAEGDMIDARVVRTDPVLDLALVHVPSAAGRLPLEPRAEPARQGERVLALGHPQQAVWSFTSGVVSAVRPGIVQHDAPINPGNSGGPLVDLHGRLLGVNTSKLLGGAEGVGFARPVDLARTLLDPDHRPLTPDLSSATSAAATCERILELAPEQSAACVRWEDGLGLTLASAERAAEWLALGPERRSRLRESILAASPEAHARAWREAVVANWRGEAPPSDPMLLGLPRLWEDPAAQARHVERHGVASRLRAQEEAWQATARARSERLRTANGLKEDIGRDGGAYARTRKRGQRIEEVHPVGDRAVWLVGAGRNADGSTWRSSSCWVADEAGRWLRALGCEILHDAPRPEGTPPDVLTTEETVQSGALRIARALLDGPEVPR